MGTTTRCLSKYLAGKTFLKAITSPPFITQKNSISLSHNLVCSSDPETYSNWQDHSVPINFPINEERSVKKGHIIPVIEASNASANSLQGKRQYQEDFFASHQLTHNVSLFGVFDGHGGAECANFCSQNMHFILKKLLETEENLQIALVKAFNECQDTLNSVLEANPLSGSTASIALLRNCEELVVGSVGDSKIILCREGKAIVMNKIHNFQVESELNRLKSMKAKIIHNSLGIPMVNGRLNMTRSMGDLDLKPFGVTATPDTRSIGIKHHKDCFLLMISDGVDFVLPDQEACDIVSQCSTPHEAVSELLESAMAYGSHDNCTALVLPFGAWGMYKPAAPIKFRLPRKR